MPLSIIKSNYSDLYNSIFDNPADDSAIWGCTDPNALNYNYEANESNDTCIYDHQLACLDESYVEYQTLTELGYSDCSCNVLENINTD